MLQCYNLELNRLNKAVVTDRVYPLTFKGWFSYPSTSSSSLEVWIFLRLEAQKTYKTTTYGTGKAVSVVLSRLSAAL